ncbi:hypothetical protein CL176_02225 [Suicoccus acidiformans]|uniref:DUF2513 domain-containing protein n=1 Tax=Suicoccus acidiformans TaxID=2036206 RepID=A0A347WIM8_9LACT|nr:DUF2513 domain-containing protein [Suicoccus acidiformans]AXY24935.1 hypothetical protein CL176_02225 [Suicoccus acidiformans]
MRLDFDLVRELLLVIEDESDFNTFVIFDSSNGRDLEQNYTLNEVYYHIDYLSQANLITKPTWTSDNVIIKNLTPAGHKFIGEIRADTNWNKTKDIAKKVGVFTLDSLKEIATGVASAAIQSYFLP